MYRLALIGLIALSALLAAQRGGGGATRRLSRGFPSPRGSRRWCVQLKKVVDSGSPLFQMGCTNGQQSIGLGHEWRYRSPWREGLVRGSLRLRSAGGPAYRRA